jgi:hypothetical protein
LVLQEEEIEVQELVPASSPSGLLSRLSSMFNLKALRPQEKASLLHACIAVASFVLSNTLQYSTNGPDVMLLLHCPTHRSLRGLWCSQRRICAR